jgi:hypothetical protein
MLGASPFLQDLNMGRSCICTCECMQLSKCVLVLLEVRSPIWFKHVLGHKHVGDFQHVLCVSVCASCLLLKKERKDQNRKEKVGGIKGRY